jgi:hypothetical protein
LIPLLQIYHCLGLSSISGEVPQTTRTFSFPCSCKVSQIRFTPTQYNVKNQWFFRSQKVVAT